MEKPIFLKSDTFLIESFDIPEPEGYEKEEGFPNDCDNHQEVLRYAEDWFEDFPNCCENHKRLKTLPDFNKEDYSGAVNKIVLNVAYTEFVINKAIRNDDWYEDITDYFEFVLFSFGQPSIGGHVYVNLIRYYIDAVDFIEREKKERLLCYFNTPEKVEKSGDRISELHIVFDVYNRWYKNFPFNLSYFSDIGKAIDNKYFILKADKIKTNRYSGISKAKVLTSGELVITLSNLTNTILSFVDTTKLYKDGKISELEKNEITIINHEHYLKQQNLITEYVSGERKYIKTIKRWLSNEKQYFKELVKVANNENKVSKEPSKEEKLKANLEKYGFYALVKVKSLSDNGVNKLVREIATKTLPYQIAMFDYLGFVDHLYDNHFKSRERTNKCLAQILNVSLRVVKGNYAVLNSKSTENRHRYTAHKEKENVIKYYNSLK